MLPADLNKLEHLSSLFSNGAADVTDIKALSTLLAFLKPPLDKKDEEQVAIKRSA